MEEPQSDFSLSEGRYVRIPFKLLWFLLAIWAGAVWSWASLSAQVNDNRRTTDAIAVVQKEDHKTLMEMHDSMVRLDDFAEESKRLYNRYFRDYNDPDRKN